MYYAAPSSSYHYLSTLTSTIFLTGLHPGDLLPASRGLVPVREQVPDRVSRKLFRSRCSGRKNSGPCPGREDRSDAAEPRYNDQEVKNDRIGIRTGDP